MKYLLSVVITLKNDQYYKDLIYRVQKTLDLNIFFLNKLKKKKMVEFIIVDWGSKNKLSNNIKVNKNFKNNVKFIHIKNHIAKKYSKGFPNDFNSEVSQNIGVRRSTGKFVLYTSMDNFFYKFSWQNLLSFLENNISMRKSILYIPRRIIDLELYKKRPNLSFYDYFLENLNHSYYQIKAHTFYLGGGFSALLSRSDIFDIGSISEKNLKGVANDLELNIRINLANFKKINSTNLGIAMYKFPPLLGSLRNTLLYKTKNTRRVPFIPKKININKNKWGLKNSKFNFTKSKCITKTFQNTKNKISDNIINDFNISFKNKFKIFYKLVKPKILFKDINLIIILYNVFKYSRIFSMIEFGFSNSIRCEILGINFKYLSILSIDHEENEFKNYSKRLLIVQRNLSIQRYGIFETILGNNFNYIKKKFEYFLLKNQSNLLLINQIENVNINQFIRYLRIKLNIKKKFFPVIIINGKSELSENKFKFINKYYYCFKFDNFIKIFVLKKINSNINYKNLSKLNKNHFIFYIFFKFFIISKNLLNRLRLIFHRI